MANKNINDLPTATSLNAGDKLEILQGGTNKQIDSSLLGAVQSVTGPQVDNTDPNNPVVNVSDLSQVLSEGYVANSSIQLTDGVSTELLLDPNYIQLKSTGLGSVLFDADAILDVVNYKGNELATVNDIPNISGLAPIASPTFTGTPLAPTASAGTNNTQIATTAYVDAKGAHQGFYTGKWKTIPFASAPTGLTGWVGGIIYIPIPIGENQTFIKIGEEVTAGIAGQNIRLALYRSVNGLPANLIEDSGNLSAVTNGLKDFTFTSPVTVNASERQVFAAIQVSNNSLGLRVANSVCLNYFNGSGTTGSLFVQVQSFGAFPASATPSAYNGVTSPLVSLLMQ